MHTHVCTYKYTWTHICMHAKNTSLHANRKDLVGHALCCRILEHIYIYMHICLYMYVYVHVYMFTYTHTHTYAD